MAKSDDKEPRDKDAPHRQIIPVAQDGEMLWWLEGLFCVSERDGEKPFDQKTGVVEPKATPDKFPERIVLCPIYGRRDRGSSLDTETYKPMQQPVPPRETLVQLANRLLGKAQEFCNTHQRRQRFAIFAFSNLKGADAYAEYSFSAVPKGKQYTERETPAADDDDTHRDRFLQSTASHTRWMMEQHSDTIASIIHDLREDNRAKHDEIVQLYAERRMMIREREQLESQKQEREERAEMAKLKREAIGWGMAQVQSLMPAIKVYLTKGKMGVVDGLKEFSDSLAVEQKRALFGVWSQDGKELVERGLLDEEQVVFFGGLLDGTIEGARVKEFILSLRQEQLQHAQGVLREDQIMKLMSIAKAVTDVQAKANGAAS